MKCPLPFANQVVNDVVEVSIQSGPLPPRKQEELLVNNVVQRGDFVLMSVVRSTGDNSFGVRQFPVDFQA